MHLVLVLTFFVLLILQGSYANSQALEQISLSNHNLEKDVISGNLKIYEDVTGELAIHNILKNPPAVRYEYVGESLEKPVKSSVYWSRVQIENYTQASRDLVLSIGNFKSPDNVEAYIVKHDSTISIALAGAMVPYSRLAIQNRYASMIPFSIEPGNVINIHLKILSNSNRSISLKAQIEAPKKAFSKGKTLYYSQALFQGATLILFLFNMLVFFNTRNRSYLYYAIYIFLWSCLYFALLGMADITLFKEVPHLTIRFGLFAQDLDFIFYLLFTRSFFQTSIHYKRLDKWISRFIILDLVFLVINFLNLQIFGNYNILNIGISFMLLAELIYTLIIVITVLKSKSVIAYYYVTGVLFLVSFSLAGYILYTIFKIHTGMVMAEVGSILEFMAFSLALAYQSKQNEIEKRRAQEELVEQLLENRKMQEVYSNKLENEVLQRTLRITKQKEEVLSRNVLLQRNNQEKEIMLAEIHHRVKNNLQVISSILNLQARKLLDETAVKAVEEGRDRVNAIALVHQKLYQNDQWETVKMDDYLSSLIQNIVAAYGQKDNLSIQLDIHELELDFEKAVSLGLIVNELISNSMKHAFEGIDHPTILISLGLKNGLLKLKVEDNGIGIPEGFTVKGQTNFGLKLVHLSSLNMDAKIDVKSKNGTLIEVEVPIDT